MQTAIQQLCAWEREREKISKLRWDLRVSTSDPIGNYDFWVINYRISANGLFNGPMAVGNGRKARTALSYLLQAFVKNEVMLSFGSNSISRSSANATEWVYRRMPMNVSCKSSGSTGELKNFFWSHKLLHLPGWCPKCSSWRNKGPASFRKWCTFLLKCVAAWRFSVVSCNLGQLTNSDYYRWARLCETRVLEILQSQLIRVTACR